MASSFECPSAMRLATYFLVFGSVRKRPIAMMCKALFACRSPPLLRRCRMVLPDEAGTGLVPHSAAKLASDRRRSGLSPAVSSSCAAPTWPMELRATRSGASSSTMAPIMTSRSADLIVQFEIAASERLEGDPIGSFHVAIGSQVRPPGGESANELHAGHAAQNVSQSIGRADDRILDQLQGHAPGCYSCFSAR